MTALPWADPPPREVGRGLPFTYASHQAPVLALKLRWPARFDGTAMVMGSMAPDWAYAFSGTAMGFDAHSLWGVLWFCVPVSVLAATVLRRVAPVAFAYAPSPPELPLGRLRALGGRRPGLATTAVSAFLGALTHVVWDLFTHDWQWGPQHVAWLRASAPSILGRPMTWAGMLQYASTGVGGLVAVVLLARILRTGALLQWYGLRADDPLLVGRPSGGFVRFWTLVLIGGGAGLAWAAAGDPGMPGRIIRLSLGAAAGVVAASAACAGHGRVPAGSVTTRGRR